MAGQGLPSGELPQIRQPEKTLAPKPPEVKAPEIKPVGKVEQTMVARIDKDGDPDLVLQDLTKAEVGQKLPPTSDASPVAQLGSVPEAGNQTSQQAVEGKVENKPLTWEQVFQSQTGKEFHNAMRGIGADGRQDVTGSRITMDYSMREFVRQHPQEAQQYMDVFQKEFGRKHPDLVRATQQVTELQQNPPQAPQEDPKYAGLAYRLDQDDEYGKFRDELNTAHKIKVFGTTDFNTIPLDRFMDLASSDANMLFSSDQEADKAFRQSHPDKAALYDERERARVYRDPDGVINRDRDPLFLRMFEPNSRGVAWTREEGMRRFAAMYPDKARGYAEKYPDLQPYIKNETASNGQPRVETVTQPQNIGETRPVQTEPIKPEVSHPTPAKALSENLQADGVESKVIPIANASGFTEAIILPKKEMPTEKMVRVYRGVNQLDASLLQQIPYAMRADSEDSFGSVVLDSVRQEVDTLATEPTYEHLLAYVNKAKPQLNENQQKRLDRDLAKMEDGILKGYSVRTEIIYDQIGHNGGTADSGISPYLSASYSPGEALGYTRPDGALLVIDVPISQIEDFGKDGTETNIKGALDSRYITAIIPRNGMDLRDQASEQAIATALQTVTESSQVPVYDTNEAQSVRGNQIATNQEKDKQQWQIDAEAVRQKRTTNLFSQFSEIGLNSQAVQQAPTESGTDIYTKTKTDIFDYYADRLSKLGRGGRNAADYEYVSEAEYGARKKFDRANVTDEMLLQLRTFVQRQEQRERERSQNST